MVVQVYNPKMGMDALQVFPCSQAAANQRAGAAPGCKHCTANNAAGRAMWYSDAPCVVAGWIMATTLQCQAES